MDRLYQRPNATKGVASNDEELALWRYVNDKNPCFPARDWVLQQSSLEAAWNGLPRLSWMGWYLTYVTPIRVPAELSIHFLDIMQEVPADLVLFVEMTKSLLREATVEENISRHRLYRFRRKIDDDKVVGRRHRVIGRMLLREERIVDVLHKILFFLQNKEDFDDILIRMAQIQTAEEYLTRAGELWALDETRRVLPAKTIIQLLKDKRAQDHGKGD